MLGSSDSLCSVSKKDDRLYVRLLKLGMFGFLDTASPTLSVKTMEPV